MIKAPTEISAYFDQQKNKFKSEYLLNNECYKMQSFQEKANTTSIYQHIDSPNNGNEMNNMLEKELWAQYILDHHIGDADYKFSGKVEPAIINRLESLGVIPESRIKNFFGFKKLDKETQQALREWAIAFYNSTTQSLSSYNRLNQAMKNIQPLPGKEPIAPSSDQKITTFKKQ